MPALPEGSTLNKNVLLGGGRKEPIQVAVGRVVIPNRAHSIVKKKERTVLLL